MKEMNGENALGSQDQNFLDLLAGMHAGAFTALTPTTSTDARPPIGSLLDLSNPSVPPPLTLPFPFPFPMEQNLAGGLDPERPWDPEAQRKRAEEEREEMEMSQFVDQWMEEQNRWLNGNYQR